jgi:ribosome-binding protein aMBF1 (putative translation factor)
MKTRHTEQAAEIMLQLPPMAAEKISQVIQKTLKSMGHTVSMRHLNDEGEELYTFEELFPDAAPGRILRGFRARDDMTQESLAARLGVTQARVSELESGKRPISKRMAEKLEAIFEIPYKAFL